MRASIRSAGCAITPHDPATGAAPRSRDQFGLGVSVFFFRNRRNTTNSIWWRSRVRGHARRAEAAFALWRLSSYQAWRLPLFLFSRARDKEMRAKKAR